MVLFLDSERRLRLPLRLLAYFIAWFAVVVTLQAATEAVTAHQHLRRLAFLVLAVPAVLGVTALFRRWLDRRPWGEIGLPPPGVLRLALGCVAAYAVIGMMTLTEWSLGWLEHTGIGVFWPVLTGFAGALAAGFIEELAFRGYFLANLGERLPMWLAAVIIGLIFGAVHLQSAPATFTPAVLVSGVLITFLLVIVRLGTGSLWAAIGLHWGWNWSQAYFYGLSPGTDSFLEWRQTGTDLVVGPGAFIAAGLVPIGVTAAAVAVAAWIFRGRIQWATPLAAPARETADG